MALKLHPLAQQSNTMSSDTVTEARVAVIETDVKWIKDKIENIETKINWFIMLVAGTSIVQVFNMVYGL